MEKLQHPRNSSLDIIRILAAIAVILTHLSAGFIDYPQYTQEFDVGNLFNSISRLGVPLFFMISGALFLDEKREVTLKGMLSKNVKNLAIITVIWATVYSIIYHVILPLSQNQSVSAHELIVGIITGHYHMWYLYCIIPLYVAVPFLRRFVRVEYQKPVLFFIGLSFLVQFLLPQLGTFLELFLHNEYLNQWIGLFDFSFFGYEIAYMLVGWYLVHVGIPRRCIRNCLYVVGAAALVLMILYVHFTGDCSNAYSNKGVLVFLYSVGVFLALSQCKRQFTHQTVRWLAELSKLTFGVYLIHPLLLTLLKGFFPATTMPLIDLMVTWIMVTPASFLVSYLMSKIPVIQKLIKA